MRAGYTRTPSGRSSVLNNSRFLGRQGVVLGMTNVAACPRDDEFVSNRYDASRLALGGIRHLRIPRSAEVSASENAGRVNRRSAYFISGAACFGIWIP